MVLGKYIDFAKERSGLVTKNRSKRSCVRHDLYRAD